MNIKPCRHDLTGIDNISKNNKFDPNTWEEPIYA